MKEINKKITDVDMVVQIMASVLLDMIYQLSFVILELYCIRNHTLNYTRKMCFGDGDELGGEGGW